MARELSVESSVWHHRFATLVRTVLAPILCLWSGFFSADFVLSGAYTWPRTSRIFVLTITLVILGYEFVYKAQRTRAIPDAEARAWQAVRHACVIPYVLGVGLLLIVVFARR